MFNDSQTTIQHVCDSVGSVFFASVSSSGTKSPFQMHCSPIIGTEQNAWCSNAGKQDTRDKKGKEEYREQIEEQEEEEFGIESRAMME